MKKWLVWILSAVVVVFSVSAKAEGNVGIMVGYEGFKLEKKTFVHDTHSDDSFLPNSGTPGSAGETSIGGGLTSYLAIGARYQDKVMDGLRYNLDLGILFGGERDQQQNANDDRQAKNGSFIYSQDRVGGFVGAGLTHSIGNYYLGCQAQCAGIYQSSGWYRWGKDEAQESTLEWYPSVGPKIGWLLTEEVHLEVGVQFGSAPSASLMFVTLF